MTDGDPTDRLSAKRHFVLVLRLVVEVDGKVMGELVDPLSDQRERFIGLACVVDALRAWIDGALSSTAANRGATRGESHPTASRPSNDHQVQSRP
jgi:hypothetical protein